MSDDPLAADILLTELRDLRAAVMVLGTAVALLLAARPDARLDALLEAAFAQSKGGSWASASLRRRTGLAPPATADQAIEEAVAEAQLRHLSFVLEQAAAFRPAARSAGG